MLELRFDTDEYVVRVLEPEAEDVYAYAEAINEDKNIDDYEVYYIDSADHNGDLELNLQGRTLYITNDQQDMGLALASDAPAVVIQDEYSKTDVKTEFTTVKAAIAHLADRDDQTSEIEYDGKIFAVLNTNGSAAWIVFDSNTGLNTSSGIEGGASGNVPTDLKESTANVTYTVASNGVMNATFSYNAPEYVADGSSVDFKVNVYANGSYYGSFNLSGTVNNGKATIPYTSNRWWFGTAYPTDEALTFSIENESFGLMKVRYFGENNERIEDLLVDETEAVSTAAAGTTIYWTMPSKYFTATGSYVVTGVNGAPISNTNAGVGVVTGANAGQPVVASGYGYVDVKLSDYTTATPNYDIINKLTGDAKDAVSTSSTRPAGATLAELGLTGDDVLEITVTSANTGLVNGQEVTFQATLARRDGTWDGNAYRVVLSTSEGDVEFTLTNNDTTGWTTGVTDDSVRVKDADVEINGVQVYEVTPRLAVDSVKMSRENNYTAIVKFNQAVCQNASTPSVLTTTDVDVTVAGRTAEVNHSAITSDTVTITLNAPFKDGDTIELKSSILSHVNTGNALTNVTYTYDGDTNEFTPAP